MTEEGEAWNVTLEENRAGVDRRGQTWNEITEENRRKEMTGEGEAWK